MVGRIYRTINCWDFHRDKYQYPVIKCRLINLVGIEYGPISLPVDTGYSGSILVPPAVYEIFKVGELPPKYWRVYSTMTGRLPMKTARGYVSINGVRIATLIETPTYGHGKFLIGREILNKLIMILDGDRGICCLAEPIKEINT